MARFPYHNRCVTNQRQLGNQVFEVTFVGHNKSQKVAGVPVKVSESGYYSHSEMTNGVVFFPSSLGIGEQVDVGGDAYTVVRNSLKVGDAESFSLYSFVAVKEK